ncbi:hypothetical protein AAMO2058_000206500 [Amorphochlora amoebiformis]
MSAHGYRSIDDVDVKDIDDDIVVRRKATRGMAPSASFPDMRTVTIEKESKNTPGVTSVRLLESSEDKMSEDMRSIQDRGEKERWWINEHEIILPKKEMCSGSCGKVYRTKWRTLLVAVKTIKNPSQKAVEDLQHEILTWSTTRHPNIVTFLGASFSPTNGVMLIMEFMKGGDLQDLLNKSDGPIPLKRAYEICLDISRALTFLHSCKPPILHRDLKPPNVLFDVHGVAKIADFGLSKFVNDTLNPYRMTAKTGTVRYMAPEVLLGRPYNASVDIYSFGMIMSYIFTGSKPFSGFDVKKRIDHAKAGIQAQLPFRLHPVEKSLIAKCVLNDPRSRPTIMKVTEMLEAQAQTRSSGNCCLIS